MIRMRPKAIFVFLFLMISGGVVVSNAVALDVSKMYVFGDSLADTGNDLALTGANEALPPIPPPTRYFEGRFSNGRIWVDFLANEFNITLNIVEPMLDFLPDASYSFAYGGSGTSESNTTPGGFEVPGLLGQVANFKNALGEQTADAEALYAVWSGSNDYILQLIDDPRNSVDNIVQAIQSLYDAGARKFVVLNLPDLGQVPLIASQGATTAGDVSALTAAHNALLNTRLGQLQDSLENSTFYAIDVFMLARRLFNNLDDFGFAAALAAGPASGCLVTVPPAEPDCSPISFDTNSLFWDEQHPNSQFHRILAAVTLNRLQAAPLVRGDKLFRDSFEMP